MFNAGPSNQFMGRQFNQFGGIPARNGGMNQSMIKPPMKPPMNPNPMGPPMNRPMIGPPTDPNMINTGPRIINRDPGPPMDQIWQSGPELPQMPIGSSSPNEGIQSMRFGGMPMNIGNNMNMGMTQPLWKRYPGINQ